MICKICKHENESSEEVCFFCFKGLYQDYQKQQRYILTDESVVKTARIDEIILFILEEDQAYSNDSESDTENFTSQIVQMLEKLKGN